MTAGDCDVPPELCDFLLEFGVDDSEGFIISQDVHDNDNQHHFTALPYEFTVGDSGWAEAAGTALRHNGFCVLRARPESILSGPCARCAASALRRLSRLHDLARAIGTHPRRDLMRWSEMCSRTAGGMRYDMRLPVRLNRPSFADAVTHSDAELGTADDAEAWAALHAAADSVARPVVRACGLLLEHPSEASREVASDYQAANVKDT